MIQFIKKINKVKNSEINKKSYLFLKNQNLVSNNIDLLSLENFFWKNNKNDILQHRNFCILSNRKRFLIKNLKISRIKLKELLSAGYINFIGSSSW